MGAVDWRVFEHFEAVLTPHGGGTIAHSGCITGIYFLNSQTACNVCLTHVKDAQACSVRGGLRKGEPCLRLAEHPSKPSFCPWETSSARLDGCALGPDWHLPDVTQPTLTMSLLSCLQVPPPAGRVRPLTERGQNAAPSIPAYPLSEKGTPKVTELPAAKALKPALGAVAVEPLRQRVVSVLLDGDAAPVCSGATENYQSVTNALLVSSATARSWSSASISSACGTTR